MRSPLIRTVASSMTVESAGLRAVGPTSAVGWAFDEWPHAKRRVTTRSQRGNGGEAI